MDIRRRDSCWKCKERHLRCTFERPTCGRCARSGHHCQYGVKLLWREDARARGICHGRQGANGRKGQTPLFNDSLGQRGYVGQFYFLNLHSRHFERQDEPRSIRLSQHQDENHRDTDCENLYRHSPNDDQPRPRSPAAYLTPQLSYFAHPDLDIQDNNVFEYYLYGLCPQLSNVSTNNPYLDLMVPLSIESPSVYHSIMSWSAHELALKGPRRHKYCHLSLKHKGKALQHLQGDLRLSQESSAPPGPTLISILATMILLSCQEITESCSSAWVSHLKAAQIPCRLLWPKAQQHADRFRRFCIMWLVSHEAMSRTAWIEKTLFDPSEWFANDDEWEIDGMIGCSRGLICQVSEIGKLIMRKRLDADSAQSVAFLTRRDSVEHALQGLGQHLSDNAAAAPAVLFDVAESKRLCALIYLYTCIDDATPDTTIIQEKTSAVISILLRLPPKPSVTFTLFVVGTLGVRNEDDRRLVFDKFTELVKARPLASITRAFEIVTDVWLDRDLGRHQKWEDLVETRAKLLSLA